MTSCTAWRKNNPEKQRAQLVRQREKMRAKLADPVFRAAHNARNNARLKARRCAKELWPRWALNQIRARAKKEGIAFNLTVEDIAAPAACPALGVALVYGGVAGEMHAPTVDRLRPELGYIKGNVRVVSRRANNIKSNAASEEVLAVYGWMRREGL